MSISSKKIASAESSANHQRLSVMFQESSNIRLVEVGPASPSMISVGDDSQQQQLSQDDSSAVLKGPLQISLNEPDESSHGIRPRLTLSAFRRPSARLTTTDPLGRLQDRYDLNCAGHCGVLGHGAFSTVRLAVRRSDQMRVAIKSIAKHDAIRGRRLRAGRRHLEEWEILRRFHDHPSIIHLLDLFETDDEIQLVMEYCEGGELFNAIKQKKRGRVCGHERYSERHAACIVAQILRALTDLHAQGIVHRDVKPENILLMHDQPERAPKVKLCDFGMARSIVSEDDEADCSSPITPSRTRSFSLVGSNFYVAPEMHNGEYDTAVDVYSLGVTLYVLLCGFPPVFCGSDVHPTVVFPSKYWGDISDDAKDLVRRMLDPQTQTRITARQALVSRWILEARNSSRAKRADALDFPRLVRSLGALEEQHGRSSPPRKRSRMERRTSSALLALADLYRATSPVRPTRAGPDRKPTLV